MSFVDKLKEKLITALGGTLTERLPAGNVPGGSFSSREKSPDGLTPPFIDAKEKEAMDGIMSYLVRGRLWELYGAATMLSEKRAVKYKDYEDMETEVIIASALELIVDDAFQYSIERAASVWADESSEYKDDIQELFHRIGLENRIWGWTYNVAKYGDFFLGLEVKEGEGVVRVTDTNEPRSIFRIEMDGQLAAFVKGNKHSHKTQALIEPWAMVHFMNNYKPTFEQIEITVKEETEEKGERGETAKSVKKVKKTVTSSYGTSCLYHTRLAYKILNLLEKSLSLARLSRSPLMRLFYVNTEGLTPKERRNMIKELEKTFRAREGIDLTNKLYDSDYNPMSFMDDLFIPITGSVGDLRAEQLGGEVDIKNMVDIDYQKNKLFAGLRIPKAFMGFEESLPGSLGSTTLTRLDIRYARMVKKVQRAMLYGLTRLCQIHIAFKKRQPPDVRKIKVSAVNVSGAEEEDRQNTFERKLNLANQFIGFIRDLQGQINPKVIVKYIFTQVVELSGVDIDALMTPPKGAGGEGGGGGYGGSFASTDPEVNGILKDMVGTDGKVQEDKVIELLTLLESKRPRERKVYSVDREPPDTFARAFSDGKEGSIPAYSLAGPESDEEGL